MRIINGIGALASLVLVERWAIPLYGCFGNCSTISVTTLDLLVVVLWAILMTMRFLRLTIDPEASV